MRRFKRWLVCACVAVTILLLGPVAYKVYDRHQIRQAGEQRLAAVVAQLDADDTGWRLADLLAAREARFPPPDQNPMTLVQAVGKTPEVVTAWQMSDAYPNWLPDDPNRRPVPFHANALPCLWDECRPLTDRLQALKGMSPGGYKLHIKPDVIGTNLEPTQKAREAAFLLHLDAVAAALAGDPDRAVSSCHACLAAGRGIGDEPFLISMLVRVAVTSIAASTTERVLGLSQPKAGLAELQAAMLAEADAPILADALRGERALTVNLCDYLEITGSEDGGDKARLWNKPRLAYREWQFRGTLPEQRAIFLEELTRRMDLARRPPHERAAAAAARPPVAVSREHILVALMLPALDVTSGSDVRSKAILRTAAVGIACERFRLAHARWPTTLAELGPLLPAVPLDPYDGKPLRLLRRPDGLTVYAVGMDGTDDGGTNLSVRGEPGTDIGFRLWDVAHRAAEPPDEPKPDEEERP